MTDSDQIFIDQTENSSDLKITFWTGVVIALAVIAAQIIGVIIGAIVGAVSVGMSDMESWSGISTGVALIVSFPIAVWWVLRKRTLSDFAWKWDNSFLTPFSHHNDVCYEFYGRNSSRIHAWL